MCLGSDRILKRNRNVMSTENLFLIVDHMSRNRKILSEAQKIGNNLFMGWAFLNFSPVFLWQRDLASEKNKSNQIRSYPMVDLSLLFSLICEHS